MGKRQSRARVNMRTARRLSSVTARVHRRDDARYFHARDAASSRRARRVFATRERDDDSWTRGLDVTFETADARALAGAPSSARGDPLDALSSAWRVLLLSDGSVTRHLSVLGRRARTEVEVATTRARHDGGVCDGAPADVGLLGRSVVRREVFLRSEGTTGEGGRPAVYAASWWDEDALRTFVPDERASMWANLRERHVEVHREIRRVYLGTNAALEEAFGERGPFWARHYIFWHAGEPITVVYEVFNPALREVIGPL